jgi:hypothetical protein
VYPDEEEGWEVVVVVVVVVVAVSTAGKLISPSFKDSKKVSPL